MLIRLNERFKITGIPMNFVLEEKKTYDRGEKVGQEYWTIAGYYPDFETLLTGLFRDGIQQSEREDMELLVQEVKNGVRAIVEQIKVLGVSTPR